MKILFVQHHGFINGSGGTEKVCIFLANHFNKLSHEVEIATCEDVKGGAMFPVNEGIKVINIFSTDTKQKLYSFPNYKGKNPLLWLFYKIRRKYGKLCNKFTSLVMGGKDKVYKYNLLQRSRVWNDYILQLKPDLIITMSISSLLEITYQNNFDIPIINSVNGRPDYDYTDILGFRSKVEMEHLENAFGRLKGIQILFDDYKKYLPSLYKGIVEVIPNCVRQGTTFVNHLQKKERYKITNIASLDIHCKQQHIAIEAFSEIASKYPDWDLYFWGIGDDQLYLQNKIDGLQLQNRIFLKGFTKNPASELKDSDVFIFPSKYEGFGLALVEAMAVGLPTLGFSSCSGVNQLIKHEENGFLAKDKDELIMYLEELINDPQKRQTFGSNAVQGMKVFDPEIIKEKWTGLVEQVMHKENK
ncbi:glycosyltransferase [Elizabethkingia meningoseptica]|uniref:glycosyltransferase n=1 Tax=Elizabethkingia meningoseptica TaxID=238 RepID=UPI003891B92B